MRIVSVAIIVGMCAALTASCSESPPLPVDVVPPIIDLTAVPSTGDIRLTNEGDHYRIGFLILAEDTQLDERWPRCDERIPLLLRHVLEPREVRNIPASAISGYQAGDTAVIRYKVVRLLEPATSPRIYYCMRAGELVVKLP